MCRDSWINNAGKTSEMASWIKHTNACCLSTWNGIFSASNSRFCSNVSTSPSSMWCANVSPFVCQFTTNHQLCHIFTTLQIASHKKAIAMKLLDINRCNCRVWTKNVLSSFQARHNGMNLQKGELQSGISTVTECRNTCAETENCFAFDWNSVTKTCWFHDADSACSPLTKCPACVHYKLIQCGEAALHFDWTILAKFPTQTICFKCPKILFLPLQLKELMSLEQRGRLESSPSRSV